MITLPLKEPPKEPEKEPLTETADAENIASEPETNPDAFPEASEQTETPNPRSLRNPKIEKVEYIKPPAGDMKPAGGATMQKHGVKIFFSRRAFSSI